MDTTTLLHKLAQRGVTLQVVGDRLRWQGPKGAMTPALRAALVDNKAEVRRRLGPQRPAKRGGLADGPGGGDSSSSAGGGICHQVGDPLPVQDLEALLAELERLETSGDRTDERIDALMAKWERLSPPPSGGKAYTMGDPGRYPLLADKGDTKPGEPVTPPSGDNAAAVASSQCHHTTAQGCKNAQGVQAGSLMIFNEGGNGAGGDNAGDLVPRNCHHTGQNSNFNEGGNGAGSLTNFDEGGNGAGGGDRTNEGVCQLCHHQGENSENARRGTGIPAHTGTDTAALERLARERWPDDPPPVTPCGWFGTHRQFWRQPQGGGWLCAICYPAPPGAQVET